LRIKVLVEVAPVRVLLVRILLSGECLTCKGVFLAPRLNIPLECIFGIFRLHFTCIPPVSHRILGTPLYPCIDLYLAIFQQIHYIPL